MDEILDYAERRSRAAIAALPDGDYEAADVLEGGPDGDAEIELRVTATIDGEALRLDFAGSADQVEGNLNCPLAVTKSAAFFAVRVLTDPDAPPCAGAHRPVEVAAPEGCVLNARSPAAVAAGNVETSSRVADLVLAALAGATPAPAQGQGTMNNFTLAGEDVDLLRDDRRRPGRLPGRRRAERDPRRDVEHAQHPGRGVRGRVPGRVRELAVRRGSGGAGRHRGGDGVVREIEALEPMRVHADHRAPPPRAAGPRRRRATARPGATCSTARSCPPKTAGELRPGDRLRLETPGGGGLRRRPRNFDHKLGIYATASLYSPTSSRS